MMFGHRFKPGSIVKFDWGDERGAVGFVRYTDKGQSGFGVPVRYFYNGTGVDIYTRPENTTRIERREALEHYREISQRFGDEFAKGGLKGAVAARRKFIVDQVVQFLETDPEPIRDQIARLNPRPPFGNLYVLRGDGNDTEIYEGLSIEEPLNRWLFRELLPDWSGREERGERDVEVAVASLIGHVFPDGFGRIPNKGEKGLSYATAYTVPEFAVGLVNDPIRLTVNMIDPRRK